MGDSPVMLVDVGGQNVLKEGAIQSERAAVEKILGNPPADGTAGLCDHKFYLMYYMIYKVYHIV